jgi:hypothetical protein
MTCKTAVLGSSSGAKRTMPCPCPVSRVETACSSHDIMLINRIVVFSPLMVQSVCSTMDIQHTISVPTKQPSSGGGGLTKELRFSRGSNNGETSRRKSSSSNNSFDLAASLFSSMQNLESSGRSLSTVLNPASTDGPLLMTTATGARLNQSGRSGFPVDDPMMGIGQNLRLPPRNLMHLFPSAQMEGSLPHSNPLQAAPNLGVIQGGYLPSSKLQGSITIDDSNMNYFTTQELMNELSRRRSERSRASAVLDATPAMFSAEQFSRVALMKGGESPDPRDSRTRRGSEDSLELLAATANFNTMKERVTKEKQNTNQTQDTCADTVDVRTVPTCFTPATKNAAKRKKDKDVLSDTSDVSEEETNGNERKKAKRSSSSNSLDVLLTALGDDLEQLDNKNTEKAKVTAEQKDKEDELLRRFSKDSLFSSMSDEDLICRPVTKNNIHDNSQRKGRQSILAPLLDTRSSYTMPSKESDAMFYPAHGLNPDYTRRLQASHSLMASLESEMIRNDIGIREFALREMQRRQLASHMMQNSLQSTSTPQLPVHQKAEQQLQLPAKLPPSDSRSVTLSTSPVSVNSDEPAEETQTPASSIDHARSPLPWNKKAEKPSEIPPRDALEKFLSAHGEKGATLREAVLKAISETESSLATIHAWDRSQGLRKCHSRTVVKTRRSRAHLKAFLMGVEPPTEPHQNRKRPKKSKSKKVNVFGPPRDRK